MAAPSLSPELSIGQTFTIVTNFMLGFGIVFQVPLVVLMAIRMGLVKRKTLADSRLVIYASLVGFAVFITPDPTMLSQLIVGVILVAAIRAQPVPGTIYMIDKVVKYVASFFFSSMLNIV